MEKVLAVWPAGDYTMPSVIGEALGRNGTWREEDFWSPFEGRREFWANLAELPWARELADLVRSRTDDWYIVTSNSRCLECIPGKETWCRRFFDDPWFRRMIPTSHKHLLASPSVPAVLIDDCDANVERFRAAGGHGIVFPAHHNSRHEFKADPMTVVRRILLSERIV